MLKIKLVKKQLKSNMIHIRTWQTIRSNIHTVTAGDSFFLERDPITRANLVSVHSVFIVLAYGYLIVLVLEYIL